LSTGGESGHYSIAGTIKKPANRVGGLFYIQDTRLPNDSDCLDIHFIGANDGLVHLANDLDGCVSIHRLLGENLVIDLDLNFAGFIGSNLPRKATGSSSLALFTSCSTLVNVFWLEGPTYCA
jgi:hypothetical protein